MSSPKVDIIIPAYNQGDYLKESVESALAQTWENLEIIIVDDGSTDDTAKVGRSFADPRVTYIYHDNKGLSGARNTGLGHSTGEYVSFLDSDDLFFPTKIQNLLSLFDQNPEIGLAAGDSTLIDDHGQPIGKTYGDGLPNNPTGWLQGNRFHVGAVLVKKEWLDKVEPFDESLRACEDWDMWLRLSIAGCKMAWLPEMVSMYRVHGQQMTRETMRMKSAMFSVLDKTFSRDDLGESWRAEEAKARSSALIKAAARAFLSGDKVQAGEDFAEAVHVNPQLANGQADQVVQTFLGWAHAPSSADPYQYMVDVFDQMPAELNVSAEKKQALLGDLAVNLAFENFAKGEKSKTKKYVHETAKIAPTRLINRKLCGIYFRSLLSG